MVSVILNTVTRINTSKEWQSETMLNVAGQDYKINTNKAGRGFIHTKVTECTFKPGENFYSTEMSFDQIIGSKTLISEKLRCTEKNISDQHARALEIFKNSKQ